MCIRDRDAKARSDRNADPAPSYINTGSHRDAQAESDRNADPAPGYLNTRSHRDAQANGYARTEAASNAAFWPDAVRPGNPYP